MTRLFALVWFMFASASASASLAQQLPAFHAVANVAADDVLNIRAAPDAGSAVIGTLAPDATGIEVVAIDGDWAEIGFGDVSGYVNTRYLTREDGPDWTSLRTPLACIGTEPFWSLDIDAAAGVTRFQTPEDPAPRVAPLTETWPGVPPVSSAAAVELPDGLAVLQPLACSDGMSDRGYGITADLFLSMNGDASGGPASRTRLSGCCRLVQP